MIKPRILVKKIAVVRVTKTGKVRIRPVGGKEFAILPGDTLHLSSDITFYDLCRDVAFADLRIMKKGGWKEKP